MISHVNFLIVFLTLCVVSGKLCSIGDTTLYDNFDMKSSIQEFLQDWNEEIHDMIFLKKGDDSGKKQVEMT
jgi:hypothetical protein